MLNKQLDLITVFKSIFKETSPFSLGIEREKYNKLSILSGKQVVRHILNVGIFQGIVGFHIPTQ